MNDIRKEITCNSCGRTRMLSVEEATDDGWKIDIEKGIVCPYCTEHYGIPMELFRNPTKEQEIEAARLRHIASHMEKLL